MIGVTAVNSERRIREPVTWIRSTPFSSAAASSANAIALGAAKMVVVAPATRAKRTALVSLLL